LMKHLHAAGKQISDCLNWHHKANLGKMMFLLL
jgi:hypothetical protein